MALARERDIADGNARLGTAFLDAVGVVVVAEEGSDFRCGKRGTSRPRGRGKNR